MSVTTRTGRAGEDVVKYGMPIGHATRDIAVGEHVHVHNLATNLGGTLDYAYAPDAACHEVHGDRGIAIFKDGVTL